MYMCKKRKDKPAIRVRVQKVSEAQAVGEGDRARPGGSAGEGNEPMNRVRVVWRKDEADVC